MDLLQVAVTAVGAFAALFLLSKLMGHRQISELSVFDYVNGITIGSIADEMATELEKPLRPLAAMVVWALLVWLLEALTSKCPRLRKYISGAPSIIFDNGKLYRRNMKKARLDLSEFLIQCRQQGFFDLGAIQTAVYEPDGRLTVLPVAARRPATPEDMGIAPEKEQKKILAQNPEIQKEWDETVGDRMIKLCIIGQNLDKKAISAELDKCLSD